MKCEKCKEREATIHLSQSSQNKITEHHLCEACAREQGISMNLKDYIGNISNLFEAGLIGSGSVFNITGGIPAFGGQSCPTKNCQTCGQSYDEFRRSGLFGCSHCYESFADQLDPLMRRVQGSTRHVGRKVSQSAEQQEQHLMQSKLSDLKKELQQAVKVEAYEKAVCLRDEIHALEKQLCSDQSGGGAAK